MDKKVYKIHRLTGEIQEVDVEQVIDEVKDCYWSKDEVKITLNMGLKVWNNEYFYTMERLRIDKK